MGLKGVWSCFAHHGQDIPLSDLAGKTVAIDGHIWLFEAVRGTQAHGSAERGAPHLSCFYNRIRRLREHGIHPVVVFDSPQSTVDESRSVKRLKRRSSDRVSAGNVSPLDSLTKECKTLLDAMGVPVIIASGDGEAYCAQLEVSGAVNGCITTDFDYFLFGGRHLYKVNFLRGGSAVDKTVALHSMDVYSNLYNLSRDKLIALAVLVGCDYYEGIRNVGPSTALEILSEFAVYEDHPVVILDRFRWHCVDNPVERITDSPLMRRLRKTSWEVPATFPNTDDVQAAVNAYLLINGSAPTPTLPSTPGAFDSTAVSNILLSKCRWDREKIDGDFRIHEKRCKKLEKQQQQPSITRWFSPRRTATTAAEQPAKDDVPAQTTTALPTRRRRAQAALLAHAVDRDDAAGNPADWNGVGQCENNPEVGESTRKRRRPPTRAVAAKLSTAQNLGATCGSVEIIEPEIGGTATSSTAAQRPTTQPSGARNVSPAGGGGGAKSKRMEVELNQTIVILD